MEQLSAAASVRLENVLELAIRIGMYVFFVRKKMKYHLFSF